MAVEGSKVCSTAVHLPPAAGGLLLLIPGAAGPFVSNYDSIMTHGCCFLCVGAASKRVPASQQLSDSQLIGELFRGKVKASHTEK